MCRSDGTGAQSPLNQALSNDLVLTTAQNHGSNLSTEVGLLKPGAKYNDQAVGRFIPNPILTTTSHVYLYVALTRLDKPSGMFSFLVQPEDSNILQKDWPEEEVVLEPGDGLLWRGDCRRKSGGGTGGVMLILRYD